jgi:deazaflavin-dependent oxidoreductase (nitroreductase family)
MACVYNIDLNIFNFCTGIGGGSWMSERNKQVIAEFRANNGKVGGFFKDKDLLLLHTTGAKSGLARLKPLVYMQYGERLVVIASNGGARSNPDWYYNLLSNPEVCIEVGSERFPARAEKAQDPERNALYSMMAEKYPFFADYQRNTERIIPVIVITPNR